MLNDIPDWIEILVGLLTFGGVVLCFRRLSVVANIDVSRDTTTSDSRGNITAGRDIHLHQTGGPHTSVDGDPVLSKE